MDKQGGRDEGYGHDDGIGHDEAVSDEEGYPHLDGSCNCDDGDRDECGLFAVGRRLKEQVRHSVLLSCTVLYSTLLYCTIQ